MAGAESDFELPSRLGARLADDDPAVRRIAVREVNDEFDSAGLAVYLRASRDPVAEVRLEAARALEGIGALPAVESLLALLDDADADVRHAAAASLAELRDGEGGPALVRVLASSAGDSRAAILRGLRELREPAALTPAIAALDDPLPRVRREAIGVLAYLRDARAIAAIAGRVIDPSPEVRKAAAGALGFAQDDARPVARKALLDALRDEDWEVREAAAVTLGKRLDPESAAGLIEALALDKYWQVRLKAADVLGRLEARAAVPSLLKALEHTMSNLRKEAANALEAIGDPSVLPVLQKLATDDPDLDVRKTAQRIVNAWRAKP
ncbi:MAG: HEAT repeat domain-containing protein [Zoogloeaceae bacterium]|jgi:HEAT repeat protein|nr:HEAT repeat domain-containing protein [Zoogloeaceae bacterium]